MNDLESRNLAERCRLLEMRVKKLEDKEAFLRQFVSVNEGEVVLQSTGGTAKLIMKKDGSISISGGSKIAIRARGRLYLVSDGELSLKGSRIEQN